MNAKVFKKRFISSLLFLLLFMSDAVIRIRGYEDKSIDLQVVLKFTILILCFIVGLNSLKYKKFYSLNYMVLSFLGLFVISSSYSPNFSYSLYISFTYIAVFLFVFYCFMNLEFETIINVAVKAFFVFAVISLFLYVFIPNLGRFAYWSNDVFYVSNRMSGLAGSANNFARIMVVYFILLVFYKTFLLKFYSLKFLYFQMLLSLTCLLLTGSRTTIAALMVSVIISYYLHFKKQDKAYLFVGFSILIVGLYFLYPSVSMYLSRHDGTDLTTFTGRVFIWDVAIELVQNSFLFGYGTGSSVIIFPDYLQQIGFKASHAHNMYLQILLSVGFVGLVSFLFIILCSLKDLLKSKNYGMISILILILLVGFLESAAIALTANMFTIILFIGLIESKIRCNNTINLNENGDE